MIQSLGLSLYIGLDASYDGDFTMKIKIKLYTILEKYAKGKVLENNTIILSKDTTLQELTRYLNIPDNIGIVFLVNDLPQDKKHGLHQGDEVKIFSFIGGG